MFNKDYKLLENLTGVKIPKELSKFWKELKTHKIKDREFHYKYFGKVIPMSPDRMNKYSKLAPVEGDRYTFYNKIYELTKKNEISQSEENEIITNSHWDPYVMTIDLSNALFKKYCKAHYIKYCVPFATTHGSSEIVFFGFTESKKQDGIFYFNSTFQEYPIFICKTLGEFINKAKRNNSRTDALMQILGNDFCYRFRINEDYELDQEELRSIMGFICNSFKKTFDKEINLYEDKEFVELAFEYRGFDRFLKFNKANLKHTESLQMICMSLNNSITEFDKNFINNYKYYLTEETIQLVHKDEAIKFIRNGLIKPYFNNPIPNEAYTSSNKPVGKYDAELLEMIKDKNWSQIEIDRFLDIYGDTGFENKSKE